MSDIYVRIPVGRRFARKSAPSRKTAKTVKMDVELGTQTHPIAIRKELSVGESRVYFTVQANGKTFANYVERIA